MGNPKVGTKKTPAAPAKAGKTMPSGMDKGMKGKDVKGMGGKKPC